MMLDEMNVGGSYTGKDGPKHPIHGRFVIRNLGPIDYAEMELGDLTVIAGHNNTGKTYLAYSIYGFLRSWNQSPHLYGDIAYSEESDTSKRHPKSHKNCLVIDRLIATACEKAQAEELMNDELWNRDRRIISHEFSSHFSTEILPSIFSASTKELKDPSVMLELKERKVQEFTSMNSIRGGPLIYFSIRADSITLSNNESDQVLNSSANYQRIVDQYIELLFPEFSHQTSVLSSERFSIALFHRELDLTRNFVIDLIQKVRNRGGSTDHSDRFLIDVIQAGTSRYALPIRDNIAYTRNIPNLLRSRSEVSDQKLELEIEAIMQGRYTSDDGDLRFRSISDCDQEFDLPLHMASSSARGMCDLYFFLRHVAKKNHLLIIDEPESHLDTANQVLLARLIAHFVKSGVRVLITTHSDYFLKELNNLIMLSSDFDEKETVLQTFDYSDHHTLNPSQVRGYIARDGGLSECSIDSFGIDWPIFDSTIDKINQASNELAYRIRRRIVD